jgi:hypothetical protein
VRGYRITSEVAFFHRRSSAVLFTDLIQQFPQRCFKGLRGIIAQLDLMTQAEPSLPRKLRAIFTDRNAARAALRRVLAWPCEKIVMAHGQPVTHGGQAFPHSGIPLADGVAQPRARSTARQMASTKVG